MIIKRIDKVVLAAFFVLAISGCSKGMDEASGLDDAAPVNKNDDASLSSLTKNLVQCPAAGDGYKFIDAVTLQPDVPQFKAADGASQASPAPHSIAYGDVTFKIFANKLTITKDGKDLECTFDKDLRAISVGDKLIQPSIALGTDSELLVAPLGALNCEAFKKMTVLGGAATVILAKSVDHTREVNRSSPPGLLIDTAKSINAPEAGAKIGADVISDDYAYLLTRTGWVGRVKLQSLGGGCVEFIWEPEQAVASMALSAGKDDNEIVVTMPTAVRTINLLNGEHRQLPIQ